MHWKASALSTVNRLIFWQIVQALIAAWNLTLSEETIQCLGA